MSETVAPVAPTPTIEVVTMKVAEQIMSDVYRRIAELEARLEAVEREADDAERATAGAGEQGSGFVELAHQLLEQAEDLRSRAGVLATAGEDIEHSDDARVLHLPTINQDPPRDRHG